MNARVDLQHGVFGRLRSEWLMSFHRFRRSELRYSMKISSFASLALALAFSISSVHAQAPLKAVSIFDGKTLEGWDYDPAIWRVEDGMIVEHWDAVQAIPTEFAHENGMF